MKNKLLFSTIAFLLLSLPLAAEADFTFNIQAAYDAFDRDELEAVLVKNSLSAYWYIDQEWWNELSDKERADIDQALDSHISEFEITIYPTLTETFGSLTGRDDRITLLFHPMPEGRGGYFNTADQYPKVQLPVSNERDMLYLNARHLGTDYLKSLLAHELIHLITFYQKEKTYGVTEDVWLNEARAEYAPTLLGYDDEYEGSNLQNRVRTFLNKPSDSLTEWRDTSSDYGAANLFIQYLVDHYGAGILVDSLKTEKTGIASLNAVLVRQGFEEDFAQIFENWAITVLINDCQVSAKYCYLNPNLKDFRITPLLNYLPSVGESTLSVTNATKDWTGNWHRFIGGNGILEVEFNWLAAVHSDTLLYALQAADGKISVGELPLDGLRGGKIIVPDFGSKAASLTIIPIAQTKTSGFTNIELSRIFFWLASTLEKEEEIPLLTKPISEISSEESNILVGQIERVIAVLQGGSLSCAITQNLYFGMSNNSQVECLQEFLKAQGTEIYPEGLVTGNFYTLTQRAVIRFQEKYSQEILTPWGLAQGNGYVGPTTREKINELYEPTGEITIPETLSLPKPVSQMSSSEKNNLVGQLRELISALQNVSLSCAITQNLYFGMSNNSQVECLQEFLKAQGTEIYPEGLVTGNFYTLTQRAVIRFQEKYSQEILAPWGMVKGNGYVGPTTRAKISELLTK